jgi:hypothetical protein
MRPAELDVIGKLSSGGSIHSTNAGGYRDMQEQPQVNQIKDRSASTAVRHTINELQQIVAARPREHGIGEAAL